jgi:predicted DsbA family dithiol-disulfide isomerase
MHPLANHPFAQVAAQAALAAHRQGKFLEMNEALLSGFRNFSSLAARKAAELGLGADQQRSARVQEAMFTDMAGQLGMDTERFAADIQDEAIRRQIAAEVREAVSVGATGTPASFVNGKYLRGAQPYERFKAAVEQALK